MARDFQINGPAMVYVKGTTTLSATSELGLSDKQITITPNFVHQDIHCDDFGPTIPPDVIWLLADVTIQMTLVHYDPAVLNLCLGCSMANAVGANNEGTVVSAGTIMGAPANNYISLNIASPVGQLPWKFPTAYLTGPPMELPLGSDRTIVTLRWRAIPYTPLTVTTTTEGDSPSNMVTTTTPNECKSSGAILWTHTLDT